MSTTLKPLFECAQGLAQHMNAKAPDALEFKQLTGFRELILKAAAATLAEDQPEPVLVDRDRHCFELALDAASKVGAYLDLLKQDARPVGMIPRASEDAYRRCHLDLRIAILKFLIWR